MSAEELELERAKIDIENRRLDLAEDVQKREVALKERQHKEQFISAAQATVAGAVIALLSGWIGATITSSSSETISETNAASALEIERTKVKGNLDIEESKQLATEKLARLEFESALILKAIETEDREDAIRNLRFFVSAGFISDEAGKISAMDATDFPSLPPHLGLVAEDATEVVAAFEGFSSSPFLDPVGATTIGYGYVLSDEERKSGIVKIADVEIEYTNGISEADALRILSAQLDEIDAKIDELVEVPLSRNQRSALVSFVWNVGFKNFEESTLLKLLNDGKYEAIPEQLRRWTRSSGKLLPGLVGRREAEVDIWQRPDD